MTTFLMLVLFNKIDGLSSKAVFLITVSLKLEIKAKFNCSSIE